MKKEICQEKSYHLPYHWMMKGYLRVSMEFRNSTVLRRLSDRPDQSILDLGCGDGYFTAQLRRKLPKAFVVGADHYLRALRFARIMTDNAPYVATSAPSLGFKKECFDAVFMLDVLEHLSANEREKALDEVGAALKPGGAIIATVPSKRLPVIPMHHDHFDPRDLETLMQRHFVQVTIGGYCIHLPIIHNITRFPIIWRIIYFTIRECDPQKAVTLIAYGKKNY